MTQFLGVEGYREKQRAVVEAREKIEAGVRDLGFRVLGRPQLGIAAFTHEAVDCLALLGKMYQRGWVSAGLVEPRALHVMLSPAHREFADKYLDDLGAALAETASQGAQAPTYAG